MPSPPLLAASLLVLAACGTNGGGRSSGDSSAGSGSETVAPAPATATPLPASTKGYELYAWEDGGNLRFTLITGTNRPKTAAELTAQDTTLEDGDWVVLNRSGLSNLTQLLERVPEGTPVVLAQHPDLPALPRQTRQSVERALADAGF